MHKVIIWALLAGVGIGIILIIYLLIGHKTAPPNTMKVVGKDGKQIEVNDYLKTAKDVTPSAVTIQQEQGHPSFFYNSDGNRYSIVLNYGTYDEFMAAKPAAEQEFLRSLNISEAEACDLNVVVENAGSLDERLQNGEFPLSFCTK